MSHGTTGLLDQRLRLYSYAASDTDGRLTESYHYEATRWGRIEPPTGRELTSGQAERERVDGVAVLAAEVLVSPGLGGQWLIREELSGQSWRVLTILPRRRLDRVHALVQWQDDAQTTWTVTS